MIIKTQDWHWNLKVHDTAIINCSGKYFQNRDNRKNVVLHPTMLRHKTSAIACGLEFVVLK